ncbi:GH92 family glycosyl hydrolase [Glaciibacter superstes]|uniref:GH92 family glycosyl hydrolase n=1 Tax=Glaciibacter superstes TaxID=501023 RepID=UPI0003B4D2BC|nr:GH92 family glycosyl hydrolase [Glaciibacter superstes]
MSAPHLPRRSAFVSTATFRRPGSLVLAAALVLGFLTPLAGATAAHAAEPTDFTTSFEPTDAAKPYSSRVELIDGVPVQQNVRGEVSGSVLPNVANVTASGENAPGEAAIYAADGNARSKWLVFTSKAWLQYQLSQSQTVVSYTLTSGGDAPERDPKNWTVLGSNDGSTWTPLDSQTDQTWADADRGVQKSFSITTPGTYSYYRLDITANHSKNIIQLADWDMLWNEGGGDSQPPITTSIGSGPTSGYNMKARVGFTGTHALRYTGEHTADGEGLGTNRLFDVNIPVIDSTWLSYNVFPELTADDLQYPSTYSAVDLHFTDGTILSDLEPLDSYGISATARGQGAGKILYPNQWNNVQVDVGAAATGKTIDGILFSYDNAEGSEATAFQGWVDDVSIEAHPAMIDGSSLTNYVDTRRGTNSSSAFSRGSNEPITAIPNAFNFLVPVTNATARSREYSYQQDNNDQNQTRFEGLGISHEPSPWMGDRNQFSVMPVAGDDAPSGNSHTRAATFSHDNETAQPDYYGVTLDNGAMAEMTPTNRGFIMQFTFTGEAGSVVLDAPTGDGDFTIDQESGAVSGWIDKGNGSGHSRMFVSGTFDSSPTATGLAAGGRALTKFATFDTTTNDVVTLRMATSLISLDQAAKNLALEVGSKSFQHVRDLAKAEWNDRLSVIEVEGASETEMKTLYGNLYRLNVYPNAQFENTGTAAAPDYKYASPVATPVGSSTATETGAKVTTGKMYVNNGFWDTYRTVWPAYAMLYPEVAAELVDGFTDQYRDGGWIARWSSPGYANIMTGTSSDVSFADTYLRGVDLPDPLTTYDAAIKNATTPSANDSVGRKSLGTASYLGYTPASQGESVSWAVEGYINDFGIGNMAAELAVDPTVPEERRAELLEESEYYLDRSKNYVNMFDPEIGFLQARNADGTFAVPADQYNPLNWWGPYTETNGWNFAFSAPQDPNGLANLYGGQQGLEDKLDTFFATPETTLGTIHEMVEARDGRYGQWGVSNQVSHHIPFMYNAAGAPSKAQAITREVLQRSYGGSDIGQGYAGDEDNGEMSAWYIFNALGFYPMQAGSTQLVLGSPLFTKATVKLEGGKSLVINAPENSSDNVYVQSLAVNGEDHASASIDANILLAGATLDFTMGAEPSDWGTGSESGLPSLTDGDALANPRVDTTDASISSVTSAGGENVSAIVDNTVATQVTFANATPSVTFLYTGAKQRPTYYTLTASASQADPSAWILEGSNDGTTWSTVDERTDQSFANRNQLKPFQIQNPTAFQQFRLSVTAGDASVALSEVELLTNGEGSEANELAFGPASGLTATAGVESSFALGILSGGLAEDETGYTASIDWGDGSAATDAVVSAPKVGNFAVSATHTFEKTGVYRATVTVTVGDGTSIAAAPVIFTVDYVDPTGIRAAYDSVCIGDDGVGANCDAKGYSFPRAGLAAGGLEAGVEHDVPGTDLTFTLPVIPAGEPDNATGNGQTISVGFGDTATQLSFIGAATERGQDEAATVNFTDGTSAVTPLQFSDWTKGGNSGATAPYGNIEVVQSSYRLSGGAAQNTASYFFSTVPYLIPEGLEVESITLPVQEGDPGATGRVHVFAIASDGVNPDLTFEAAVGDDIESIAGESVSATLASVARTDAAGAAPQARVQWGDATVTEDAVVAEGETGELLINGTHVYSEAGTYPVSVTIANASATVQLALTATVSPAPVYTTTLTVSPDDGILAGDEFGVAGSGFAAGEEVVVDLHTPILVTTTVTANDSGEIETNLIMPPDVDPALYSVVATGAKSKMPATATVLVVPPVVDPVYDPEVRANAQSGRPGDLVTVTGHGLAPGESVEVVFHSDPVTVGTLEADLHGAVEFTFAVPADASVGEHSIIVTGDVSAQPVELPFDVLPPVTPGDGSGGTTGPTDPSAIANLSHTGVDGPVLWLVGGLAAVMVLAGLMVIGRRRRRA